LVIDSVKLPRRLRIHKFGAAPTIDFFFYVILPIDQLLAAHTLREGIGHEICPEVEMHKTLITVTALAACAFTGSTVRLSAQSARDSAKAPAVSRQPKSATTATLLSVVPGLGHLYAEDRRTGYVLATLFVGEIAFGVAGENATSSPIIALLVGGTWWYGVIDAHNAVARYNRSLSADKARVTIAPLVVTGTHGRGGLTVAVRLR
jgi:hypothetical protein